VGNLTHELDSFSRNAEPKQPVPSDQHLVAFILRADAFRGNGEVSELTIPSTASMVALRLVFPADTFSSYSLSIETADKEAVWREQHVKGQNAGASSKEIVVRVPARALKAGDYALRISASNGDVTEDVAGYSFRVKRR
jgi:hypothetical protein